MRLTKDVVEYVPDDDEAKTFEIKTQEDLDLIRQHPLSTFELKNDIELTGTFEPIPELDGVFNGNGHTISGLTVDTTVAKAAFILKNYGTIRNVGFTNVSIDGPYTGDNSWRATICVENHGTVEQCYARGNVKGGHRDGGLVSENYSTIRNSYFVGNLESNYETGGITSWNNGEALVENCYASGNFLSRGNNIGVIGGYAYTGTVYRGNVALGGSLIANANYARICGRNNGSPTYTNNLANADVLINGNKVTTGSLNDLNGQGKTAEELRQAAAYTAIGWNFTTIWKMDAELGRPVLIGNEEEPQAAPAAAVKNITLQIGADETQQSVVWYGDSLSDGKVQLAPKSAMTGGGFPAAHREFSATAVTSNVLGFRSFRAAMDGLDANTEYVYRVGNDEGWSDILNFKTQDFGDDFSFLFAGDPQIGSSGNVGGDGDGWNDTLNKSLQAFPQSSFLISAGDQVESSGNESQYDAFLSPEKLTSIPMAVNLGNHDVGSSVYSQHFSMPNVSALGVSSSAGAQSGDYWYRHNNTLFLTLNSNNTSVAEHIQFLRDTIQAHGEDAAWKVVTFHHSIYSVANHSLDTERLAIMRDGLVPIFSELGIDVVLMGHDHSYTRTYMMDGTTPIIPEGGVPASVRNPDDRQVLYITANSASGSKYYAIKDVDFPFAAVKNQESVPNITKVDVTDTSFTVTTYRMTDMSVMDTFTIDRTPEGTLPSIITDSLPGGTVDTAYSQTLTATGAPITWSVESGDLPDGLTLSEDGVISGTPTESGTFTFTVKATNSTGPVTKELSIQIAPKAPTGTKPTVTTANLSDGSVGTAYSQTLTATGDVPITWSLADGALPDGLTLSENGAISGTPTKNGMCTFTVKAENDAGFVTKELSIEIAPTPPTGTKPTVTTSTLPSGKVRTAYSQTLTVTGDVPITWSLAGGRLPTGLTLSDTGLISGTPTTSGTYSFTVKAENGVGYATKALSIVIRTSGGGGGGNSGGGNSGGSGNGGGTVVVPQNPPEVTTVTDPGQPSIARTKTDATVTNNTAAATITDSIARTAIEKAQEEAKNKNNTENGIGVDVAVAANSAASHAITMERAALDSLISAGVKQFDISGIPAPLNFNQEALQEIQRQSTGNLTITLTPTSDFPQEAQQTVGSRPVYDITVSYERDGQTVRLTSLGNGGATIVLPYTPGPNEKSENLYAVYIDGNGTANRIAGSAYQASAGGVVFTTNHFSVYGVGYSADAEQPAENPAESNPGTDGSGKNDSGKNDPANNGSGKQNYPATGDNPMDVWILALCVVTAAGLILIFIWKRKPEKM